MNNRKLLPVFTFRNSIVFGCIFITISLQAHSAPQLKDTNFVGNDIGAVWNANDPGKCQTECDKNNNCKAWTWVKPGAIPIIPRPNLAGFCALKGSIPNKTPDVCCVSGYATGSSGNDKMVTGKVTGVATIPEVDAEVLQQYARLKFCQDYAYKAVAQNLMKEKNNAKCYLLKGPRWNASYDDHYNWCVQGENDKTAPYETKAREVALNRCINPLYLVDVTLEKVEVHDDCDNVSFGEWALSLIVDGKDKNHNRIHKNRGWPGRGTATTVATGSILYPRMKISFVDMPDNEKLVVSMRGVDCDGGAGRYYESWSLEDWEQPIKCEKYSEEFPEVSGANDYMGKPILTLSPAQWKLGGTFLIKAPENTDCSDKSAYTAYIQVLSTRKEMYAPPERVK
jgi:PAN domain